MKKTILFGLILMICIPNILHADDFAVFRNTVKIAFEASGFYWDEHDDGDKLLDETGVIYGTGVIFNGILRPKQKAESDRYRLIYGGEIKLDFGTVDYDGHTQDGNPVTTEVDYLGITFEGHLGWLIKTQSPHRFVSPELGLGFHTWSRDLNSTSRANGYTEYWTNLYARTGLGFIFPLNDDLRWSVSGGANIPIRVTNSVDSKEYGEIDLSPEAFHPTPYCTIAFDYKRVGVSFYYDSFFFGESDKQTLENGRWVVQPESYTYKAGVELTFRVY